MLHTRCVDSATLELLRRLTHLPFLQDFYLVGGTALALYFGHRKSIDLDLFTNNDTDWDALNDEILTLETYYPRKENPLQSTPRKTKHGNMCMKN